MQLVRALAKLTSSLRVTGVRHDGFHLLDAEMITIDLADELTFSEGNAFDVVGRGVGGVDAVGLDRASFDLVPRALAAVHRTAHVRLEKRIPLGAGLGGGSADAAAVLRWAGCDNLAVAVSLGADVPFCLVGGRARVTGIGEIVERLPFEVREFTLLTPPIAVDTAAVYRRWDELGGPTADGPNDLEPAALAVEPALAEWRDRLGDAAGRTPQLAGSGSTWFVDGAFPDVVGAVVTRADRP